MQIIFKNSNLYKVFDASIAFRRLRSQQGPGVKRKRKGGRYAEVYRLACGFGANGGGTDTVARDRANRAGSEECRWHDQSYGSAKEAKCCPHGAGAHCADAHYCTPDYDNEKRFTSNDEKRFTSDFDDPQRFASDDEKRFASDVDDTQRFTPDLDDEKRFTPDVDDAYC